jgi:hypothetical protein
MRCVRLVSSLALLAVAGCAAVRTPDGERLAMRSPEFRAYVERVFREQNRVADEVAFALDAPGAEQGPLAAGEQRMLEACAGVNELATARRDEQRLGVRRSLQAARGVPLCEEAMRSVAALLAESRP